MRFEHPAPFGARWPARWIWFEPAAIHLETATRPVLAEPLDRIGLLRRTVQLERVPATAPCRIWADARYHLRVNGVDVAHGPVRSDPRRGRYDVVDLAPHLVEGRNVLAVVVRHFGDATSWWMPVPPTYALGAGSFLFEAHVGDEVVVSDSSWKAISGPAWTAVAMPGDVSCLPIESFDARLHPWGWDRDGFDDEAWAAATEQVPFHTGAHGDPHPPSEPYGALWPPVRTAFPSGARHQAELVGWRTVRAAAMGPDPVAQVLADEHQVVVSPGDAGPADDAGAPDGVVRVYGFDLGRIAAGRVQLVVEAAARGTVIDVAAAEHVGQGASPPALVPLGQHAGFRYVCAGGEREVFETLEIIGARHLRASVRRPVGESDESWPRLQMSVTDHHRPRPAGASFACSDPLLERIHAVGLRTVDLCALDAYVDCPTREQRAWTGDSVVHQMVDLVANPDWSMARWHPQLAASPRPDGMLAMAPASDFEADDRTFVPDWSLHWVRALHNLYRYTGDRDLVAELLPVAERTLRWFESYLGEDGLLHDVSGWTLLDWAAVYAQGTSSVLNALWARGLEDFADMAEWLGNAGAASWARHRYEGVRAGFDAFWDEGRETYVDHVVAGVARRPAAQHPSAAALAAGLVPAARIEAVVARMTDRSRLVRRSFAMDSVTPEGGGIEFMCLVTGYPEPDWDVEEQVVAAEPFFRYVVHDGLARAGRADSIAEQCRDWQVFLDAGETTWPECWNGGTRCHGWSSTPTRDLIVHVLGIQPGEPGFDSVVVRPALGDLAWARATVPTPHGPITVEARSDGTVTIDSPVPVIR